MLINITVIIFHFSNAYHLSPISNSNFTFSVCYDLSECYFQIKSARYVLSKNFSLIKEIVFFANMRSSERYS